MKRRLSRPLLPGSPTLPDRCGAICSHCASFNTNRIKDAPHFFSLESSFFPFGNPVCKQALVIAFEASNGFHDTANAVATVIYTKSLPPIPAVIWSG
jgi:hypothetical protein